MVLTLSIVTSMDVVYSVALAAVVTVLYYWVFERETYRSSWRIHAFGIGLPIVVASRTRDPVILASVTSFATIHMGSIVSELTTPP